ncbi:hypothetical protein C3920_04630 [Novacetimonas pomaceti]|uniref:Uncharacterized protein n=1 Tax=Novacetimonas pomaceti TaxID=2021998 RepID=A0ABX5P3U3_9PROT|nr:hypothetical protein C3920_04630 [Novacetimonas pomaceti]
MDCMAVRDGRDAICLCWSGLNRLGTLIEESSPNGRSRSKRLRMTIFGKNLTILAAQGGGGMPHDRQRTSQDAPKGGLIT